MKKILLSLVFIFSLSILQAQHAFVEQDVFNSLASVNSNTLIPVFIVMDDVVDIDAVNDNFKNSNTPVKKRPQVVMQLLKAKANATQPELIEFIENSTFPYANIQRFWITNTISVNASPELIEELSYLESVGMIASNFPQYGLIEPTKGDKSQAKSVGGIEPGLAAIGAPEMWALGYTGNGRIAMTFDTGTWPEHPALENRYLPNRMPLASTWFGYDSPVPVDKSSSHGTHVSGIMLGLDSAMSDTIGVAPRAYLIATDPIVSNLADVKPLSELMLGFEWAMNPDGDETTSNDIPDVINNSWGRDNSVVDQDWTTCPELVASVMSAVQAAGIANVFSAGNEGPDPMTIGVPHNINTGLVNSFTVAAVNGNVASNWPVATFSSRGPSLCGGEGSLLIKPEVSAPGVNVRSSVGNGEYDEFSGTSMASPHVSGAILLLKEAFPYLSGEDLMLALYYSATDLGATGEDNTFGMGMINVKDAFDYLSETNTPVPPAIPGVDLELLSIDQPSDNVLCSVTETGLIPIITIRNNGLNDITGISVNMQFTDGSVSNYTDSELELLAGVDTQIELPQLSLPNNPEHELHIWIEPIEDEYDTFNNHNVSRFKSLPVIVNNIFSEDFENGLNPETWTVLNADANITWDTLSGVLQANGELGTAAWMNHRDYTLIASQKDYLLSPIINAPVTTEGYNGAYVSFDLFYRKKSNNSFTTDTLVVSVRQECNTGEIYNTELFRKGGDDLYTVIEGPSPNLPQDIVEWVNFVLEIPLVNETDPSLYVTFESINRRGNNLLIDNVNIEILGSVGLNEAKGPKLSLFPNPAKDSFTINAENLNSAETLAVIDIHGRKVIEQNISSSQNNFNVSALAKGVYMVSVRWEDGKQSMTKLVIQ